MEEAKKMKCYKRLMYKQFVQVSGLCSQQFRSYLQKCFTQLWKALHGDAILVPFAKAFWGITFLGTKLKSAAKPPDGLEISLCTDPLTDRRVKAGVQGKDVL